MFWFWFARWTPDAKLKVLTMPMMAPKWNWVQPRGAKLLNVRAYCITWERDKKTTITNVQLIDRGIPLPWSTTSCWPPARPSGSSRIGRSDRCNRYWQRPRTLEKNWNSLHTVYNDEGTSATLTVFVSQRAADDGQATPGRVGDGEPIDEALPNAAGVHPHRGHLSVQDLGRDCRVRRGPGDHERLEVKSHLRKERRSKKKCRLWKNLFWIIMPVLPGLSPCRRCRPWRSTRRAWWLGSQWAWRNRCCSHGWPRRIRHWLKFWKVLSSQTIF